MAIPEDDGCRVFILLRDSLHVSPETSYGICRTHTHTYTHLQEAAGNNVFLSTEPRGFDRYEMVKTIQNVTLKGFFHP